MSRYPYSFDRIAGLYDETRPIPDEAVERIVATIRELVGGGRLLEVGAGTARLSLPLQRARVSVVGTDVSREMIRIGQRKGFQYAVLADAYHLPFADGTFQVAMTNRLLHLLEDWRGALREIGRTTQGWYVSVLERESAVPDLELEYVRGVEGRGGNTKRPGLYERDLASQLSPDRIVAIGRFGAPEQASHTIAMLEKRIFSSQWSVPEEIHRDTIATLRNRFHGVTIQTQNEIELAIWRVGRLLDFVGIAPSPA